MWGAASDRLTPRSISDFTGMGAASMRTPAAKKWASQLRIALGFRLRDFFCILPTEGMMKVYFLRDRRRAVKG
jgi:hypothetical protein